MTDTAPPETSIASAEGAAVAGNRATWNVGMMRPGEEKRFNVVLLLEKADDPDPIQIGKTTTYTVRVMNQGSADENNVIVIVTFPKELAPVAAEGGKVEGQTVTFPSVQRLGSKQAVRYTIKAKGVAEGDARVKFSLTADGLKTPVNAEESTRIF